MIRLGIANQETWDNRDVGSTFFSSVCAPTFWSSNHVECTMHFGPLVPGSNAWVFIIAGDGTVSDQDDTRAGSQGYHVVLQ